MPLTHLPKRQSLVAQTIAVLDAQIAAREWRDWLPSERSLCHLLQVSRNTLRAALAQMTRDGRIRPVHGAGNQILDSRAARRPRRAGSGDVGLLTPEPIERLRPVQTLWIDEMRALLSERGIRLRVFHGRHYYSPKPGAALHRLVTRSPHGCWMVMLADKPVQRWFSQNRIPCVIAGSVHAGVALPFRDLDHRAMCRHAAGVLLGLGHRRLVLLTPKSRRAGDLESEAGFIEGVRGSRHADAEAVVLTHEESVAGVVRALGRVLKLRPAATALLVVHPHNYLAVASRLARSGVRVPEDISLISRDDDPFLSYLAPAPARYVASPQLMAKSLLRPVLDLLEGNAVTSRASLIMPEFLRGESIAAPPR